MWALYILIENFLYIVYQIHPLHLHSLGINQGKVWFLLKPLDKLNSTAKCLYKCIKESCHSFKFLPVIGLAVALSPPCRVLMECVLEPAGYWDQFLPVPTLKSAVICLSWLLQKTVDDEESGLCGCWQHQGLLREPGPLNTCLHLPPRKSQVQRAPPLSLMKQQNIL